MLSQNFWGVNKMYYGNVNEANLKKKPEGFW